MQEKPPILHWETAPQQLGLVFDPTLEAHPIGGKSLSPPKCQRKRGTIFEPEVVVVILWHIYLGSNDVVDMWKISGIVYLAWKFLTLLFQWGGAKRFLVSTESSRLTHPAGNRQVPSFTAGPCFFFPMFSKRFPMLRSLTCHGPFFGCP